MIAPCATKSNGGEKQKIPKRIVLVKEEFLQTSPVCPVRYEYESKILINISTTTSTIFTYINNNHNNKEERIYESPKN